jgi:PST family polysaccharide transporter
VSLLGKAIRGAIWSVGGSIGSRIVGVVGTLILTRFLSPEVAGEVGSASILVLSAGQLSSIGLGQYVVAKPGAGRHVVFHATLYHVLLGAIAIGAILLLARPIAPLLGSGDIAAYVPGLALALLFDRLAYVPERVLVRDMRFRAVAMTRASSEVLFAGATVGLAAWGMGGESIVIGNIVQSGFRLAVFAIAADRREWLTPARLDRAVTRDLLRFGWPLWVGGTTHFASRKWDNLLFAGIFGPGQMGLYNLAYNLADIPATNVGEAIGDVLLPAFARMEKAERAKALVRSTALLALIVFPLAVGLGAVAPPLVRALFNEEWQGIGPLLMILSVLSIVRPISWTVTSYLFAADRPRLIMGLEVGKTLLLLAAVAGLAHFGALWACVGVGVAFTAAAVAGLWALRRTEGISSWLFVPGFLGPFVACIPMAAAVVGVQWVFRRVAPDRPLVETCTCILVGALVYVAGAFVFARQTARDCIRFAKNALRRRRADSPSVRTGVDSA